MANLILRLLDGLSRYPALSSAIYASVVPLLMYRNNVYDVPFGEVIAPIIVSIIFVYASYFALRWAINDKPATEIATLFFTVFAVHFGRWFEMTERLIQQISGGVSYSDVVAGSALLLAGFVLAVWLGRTMAKRSDTTEAVNRFILVSILSFFLISLVSIIYLWLASRPIFTFTNPVSEHQPSQTATQDKPDIYFFVFDRYANNETLKRHYDFDNQQFLSELETRGFLLNENEYSNYPHTATSLASTLNMDYLDSATEDLPPKYSELVYAEMINQAAALKQLKSENYQINWSGSWWGPTRTNQQADITYDEVFRAKILGGSFVVSNWQEFFLGQHILGRVLASDLPIVRNIFHYNLPDQRELANYQFENIRRAVSEAGSGPQLSYFHFLTPHPLYVFDEDGSVPDYHQSDEVNDVPEKIKYINQLKYINKRILESVDYILEHSPTPPIIIFQSDEGPYQYDLEDGQKLTTVERRQWKYGVLSAFYMPGYDNDEIDLSPVNIFPFVFNNYLGQEAEYKQNYNYWYTRPNPYEFEDITDVINK